MNSELSILIPTFNYNVFPLVSRLHAQLVAAHCTFEIVVYDDCSTAPEKENEHINSLSHSSYTVLNENIGRSAIRNKLANDANYEVLLFLDADTMVIRDDFIAKYIENLNPHSEIIYGGITYQDQPPHRSELLRWKYGNEREALPVSERLKEPHLRFLTLNFLIRKNVFERLKFNEDIPNLRHEDTLFALDSKKKGIKVDHIDNPVMHLGLETSEVFLRKSRESVDALILFVKEGLIDAGETALSAKAEALKKQGMAAPIRSVYDTFGKMMERNLLSGSPSLFIFDLYRLGYYLKNANTIKK